LFEKLRLPNFEKRLKTGYSTSVDVLEKAGARCTDRPKMYLDYRQIAKLLSTYVDGLLKVIHKDDSKVHTRYLQTLNPDRTDCLQ